MEHLLEAVGHKLYVNEKHHGYLVPWKAIAGVCRRWEGNRECDPARVEEMLAFHKAGGYIPLYFHMAELKTAPEKEKSLVCYDGNHRREVLDRICGPADLAETRSDGESEDNPWCILDVMMGATPSEVAAAFESLNKAVQVPAIYVDGEILSDVRAEISALGDRLMREHPAFVSASPRCKSPNFNRDIFVDDVAKIYLSFRGRVTVGEISELLDDLDAAYAKGLLCRPHDSYPPAAVKKCQKYGFWLFLEHHVTPKVLEDVRRQRLPVASSRASPR